MGKVDQGVFTYWLLAPPLRPAAALHRLRRQGKQVRDLLHVDDLVELIDEQLARPGALGGRDRQRRRRARVQPLAARDDRALPRAHRERGAGRRRRPRPRPATCRIYLSDCARAVRAHRLAAAPRRRARSSPTSLDWIARQRGRRPASRSTLRLTARTSRDRHGLRRADRLRGRRALRRRPGYDVVGIENDMRARFFGPAASTRARHRAGCRAFPRSSARSSIDIRDADGVARVFARARGADRARHPHGRAALARLGGVGPADRLRRQRQRHAEPARGDAPPRARRDVRLHLDEQGLRRHAEPPAARGAARRGWSCRRTTATSAASTRRCRSTRSTHSLFGVSKAAADLLVQEYGRYFDMPTVCFRGGCLTGPNHAGAQLHGFLVLPHELHRHRRAVHGLRLRRQAGARQHPQRRPRARASTPSTRAPRAGRGLQPRRRARQSNCSMLEAIAAVRADRRPRARLDALRRGADRRPPLVDQRPRRVPARLPGLAARATTSRRSCARSTTHNVERWTRPPA